MIVYVMVHHNNMCEKNLHKYLPPLFVSLQEKATTLPMAHTPSTVDASSSNDAAFTEQVSRIKPVLADQSAHHKRAQLQKMKNITSSLLAIAALIYIICVILNHAHLGHPYVGYIQAAAEAGMVGGFADWFAVTALFRYPLGIKIPHTAIIPRKKDQFALALSDFVGNNFLTPENIVEKIHSLDLPQRAGDWLKSPENSQKLGDEVSAIALRIIDAIADEDAEQVIQHNIIDKLTEPQWGPPLGKLITHLLDEDKHLPLIDILAESAYNWALGAGQTIDKVVNADMPKWAPKFVNSLLGYKIHSEVVEFTQRVKDDPQHDMRKAMSKFFFEFADDLQFDPVMITKVENIKYDILARDNIQRLAQTSWQQMKKLLVDALGNPHSALRTRFVQSTINFGYKLHDDEQLQTKIDQWVDKSTRMIVTNYSDQITSIITETIQRWDATDASENIELHVGKDLQFIRINGTLVGALTGLVIYSLSQILAALL